MWDMKNTKNKLIELLKNKTIKHRQLFKKGKVAFAVEIVNFFSD